MTTTDLVAGLLLLAGVVGVVVPLLPGSVLVVAALIGWAALTGGATAWIVAIGATVVVAAGAVTSYLLPGRRLQEAGVSNRTLLLAGLLGIVGFFVVPVVGLPLGFVLGVYLVETGHSPDRAQAWRRTQHAVRAVGLSILIELLAALAAVTLWAVGVTVV